MIWGDRSGREPLSARSPLRFRRAIALAGGTLCGVATAALVIVVGWSAWLPAAFLAAAALAGFIDVGVITRRLRARRGGV